MVKNYEKRNDSEQSAEENEWSELERLNEEVATEVTDDFAEAETEQTRNDRIIQAGEKVREVYEKMNQPESEPTQEIDPTFDPDYDFGASAEVAPKKESAFAQRTAARYAERERSRVDRIKAEINDSWDTSEYENRKIETQPSTRQKWRRLLMDRLGIRTKRSEDLRNREATTIALQELQDERIAKEQQAVAKEEAARAQREAERAEKERAALERGMSGVRKLADQAKNERFRNQRSQEIVERDLNERLMTPDKLEEAVLMEEDGVEKRSISYGDKEIPVYDLKGLPFSMLSTTIDYRENNNEGEIGTETYKAVMEDPSLWAQRRDEAEQSAGYGTRNGNARGDTISTSYYNSEKNLDSYVPGNLIYGFAGVGGDSIISVSNGDGGTGNTDGRMETKVSSIHEIDSLESAGSTASYNEVLLRRYDADGRAKRPDFIICENGNISEAAKRHAAYYNIPIVNIDKRAYEAKAVERGRELVESIDETSSYEEIDDKIDQLRSMSQYKDAFHALESIGRKDDTVRSLINTEEQRKMAELAELEFVKRLDFLMDALQKATDEVEAATAAGKKASSRVPGFDSLTIILRDVQNGVDRMSLKDERNSGIQVPKSCNNIFIDFKLAGSGHNVTTRIYDGEHPYQADGEEGADSSYYAAFEPVVNRYIEAVRRNNEAQKEALPLAA